MTNGGVEAEVSAEKAARSSCRVRDMESSTSLALNDSGRRASPLICLAIE